MAKSVFISQDVIKERNREMLHRRIRKFYTNKLSVIGTVIMIMILAACLFIPFFSTYDYQKIDIVTGSTAPGSAHIFGTDPLGRDMFIRCMVGGRYSIFIGVVSAFTSTLLGVVFGAVAGYFGGKADALIIRLTEIFQSFPQMVLVMIMVTVFGRGLGNLMLIFTLTGWMSTARLVRNEFMAIKNETYVKASEAFGMNKVKIMFQEIIPNIMTPIVVAATALIPGYILSEASLSFLGVGVSDAIPTWGNIMNAATSLSVITNYWWMWVIPAIILILFVLSVNFFGDGLRDLMDPR